MQNIYSNLEWLRLPKAGTRCTISGLSRTGLCELTVACERNNFRPPVRSVLIKKRGAQRGVRLIDKNSLASYLNRLAEEQCTSTATAKVSEKSDQLFSDTPQSQFRDNPNRTSGIGEVGG